MNVEELTPVERRGGYWFKRDDLFEVYGARGGRHEPPSNLFPRRLRRASRALQPQAQGKARSAKLFPAFAKPCACRASCSCHGAGKQVS